MKNSRINTWTIILFISLIILLAMGLISNALEIGERLGRIHISLEILFYVLIAVVVLGGVVYPLVAVFFSPIFSLKELHNADGSARQKWCKRLVNNLLENVELTPEEQEEIKGYLKMEDETDDRLIEFFDRKISPEVNAEIYDTAKKVFIITAVSQTRKELRKKSYAEALSILKNILKQGVDEKVKKPVKNFFDRFKGNGEAVSLIAEQNAHKMPILRGGYVEINNVRNR